MSLGKFTLISTLLILSSYVLLAQSGRSAYSLQGIGDVNFGALSHNEAMGGLGISNGSPFFINNMNPALLTLNTRTIFDIGINITNTRFSTRLGESGDNWGGGLNYIALAFPVVNGKLATSFGIAPYSQMNYLNTSNTPIEGTSTNAVFESSGFGGITEAYWATGGRLFNGFNLGVRFSYLFGTIDRTITTGLTGQGVSSDFRTSFIDRYSFSGIETKLGANYTYRLSDEKRFNLGATYTLGGDIDANTISIVDRVDQLGRSVRVGGSLVSDTTVNREVRQFVLPQKLAFGLSYQKVNKVTVGADLHLQNWADFRNPAGTNEGLRNSMRAVVGVEWIPDITSVSSYFKRSLYRFGLYYEETPFVSENLQISDFGINFGVGLPLANLSTINLGARYGFRALNQNLEVSEQHFNIYMGFSFSDRWFIQRKYD
ncbi:MAG: hypothetical protein LAT68_04100 [Cyclobacteriaceae bacterium]|nr:hypothetical protein [Cyclobacteriaceae bacterium]MCH8515491.1 hypothetical protein [Cyclobacteriaceae bacterium]